MGFARRTDANQAMSHVFKYGPLNKIYLAVVAGRPEEDSWCVDRPISKRQGSYYCPEDGSGKPSRTEFTVLERRPGRTLVQARPLTGRTHQIRLHLAATGLPILGETAYGGAPWRRLMLHASSISFNHPATGSPLTIASPTPDGFLSSTAQTD
jgi:23S rRNA pseudouridine1911/1915/1917 synthase